MVETTDPAYAAVGALSRYNIRIVDVKLYIMTGKLLIRRAYQPRSDGIRRLLENDAIEQPTVELYRAPEYGNDLHRFCVCVCASVCVSVCGCLLFCLCVLSGLPLI